MMIFSMKPRFVAAKRVGISLKGMTELLLENGCHLILNRFFHHLPCYSEIMQTVTETFMVAMLGHQYELQVKTKMGLDHFTLDCFTYQNMMKGSYHRFYMPAALAMLLAG